VTCAARCRLLLGGLALAGAAACFSEQTAGPPETDLTCARAVQPPGPDTAFVVIQGFAFAPAVTQVAVGTRVVWINCESSGTPGHTTTATDGAWDSPTLTTGQVFSDVPATGTHDYYCRVHPFMTAQVVVQ
jgi:plastocyanin